MKKFFLSSAVLVAFAAINSAGAARKPPPPPPPPPPVYNWTGLYVGLNGGYSWGNSSTVYAGPGFTPFSTSQSLDGGVFGGQIGYNWQFNHVGIFGVEADIQGTGQNGTAALPTIVTTTPIFFNTIATASAVAPSASVTTTTASLAQKLAWFGTARLRLGFLPADNWMLYVTGGLAFGELDSTATATTTTVTTGFGDPSTTATAAVSGNGTNLGWTVGAGAEWVISGPWTAKLEYLYVDLATFNNAFTGLGPAYPLLYTSSHVTDNILRAGVNFRFGPGGPYY